MSTVLAVDGGQSGVRTLYVHVGATTSYLSALGNRQGAVVAVCQANLVLADSHRLRDREPYYPAPHQPPSSRP